MKHLLFAAITLATAVTFAKSSPVVDDEETAVEALNAYCTSSTQIYENQIQTVKNQIKAGSISDSDLEKAIDSLANLHTDIKNHCE